MKKYFSLIMIMILIIINIIPAMATTESVEQALGPVILYQNGDIDADGRITVADARLCLRGVVGLEELNEAQRRAADVTGDGIIGINCARNILRASIGMEQFDSDCVQTSRDVVIIKPFLTAGSGMYQWECTVFPEDEFASVQRFTYDIASSEVTGAPVAQQFYINLKSQGTFVFVFELNCSWMGEVLQKYTLTVEKI